MNVSQTLYSKRMGKEIARLDLEEKRLKMRAKEIARTDPKRGKTKEEDVQIFVKTCGGLWG